MSEKSIKMQELSARIARFWANLSKGDPERGGIIVLLAISFIAGAGILLIPKKQSGGGHAHGHGHGEGEHGEDHEEGLEEERTATLTDDAIEASGIEVEKSEPKTIRQSLKLSGMIVANQERYAEITPRFPGVVQHVSKRLGDRVSRGETLATVESVAARAAFDVKSGVSGIVVDRRAVPGLFFSDKTPMFKVADLSSVWVEFNVPDNLVAQIAVGQKVRVLDTVTQREGDAKIIYVSGQVDEETQSSVVRASMSNEDGGWFIGGFVEAEIWTKEANAAVAVQRGAIQEMDGKSVVFVKEDGDEYQARSVLTGAEGEGFVEVIEGISPGDAYVSKNSFIIKAEILKSTAEHEH